MIGAISGSILKISGASIAGISFSIFSIKTDNKFIKILDKHIMKHYLFTCIIILFIIDLMSKHDIGWIGYEKCVAIHSSIIVFLGSLFGLFLSLIIVHKIKLKIFRFSFAILVIFLCLFPLIFFTNYLLKNTSELTEPFTTRRNGVLVEEILIYPRYIDNNTWHDEGISMNEAVSIISSNKEYQCKSYNSCIKLVNIIYIKHILSYTLFIFTVSCFNFILNSLPTNDNAHPSTAKTDEDPLND